jgi:hypothetical protein
MAASMLAAHGVDAHVLGDDAGGAAPHVNLGSGGGYALSVPDADREVAVELLHGEAGADRTPDGPRGGVVRLGRVLLAVTLAALFLSLLWSLFRAATG